jgi:hypothetical protein
MGSGLTYFKIDLFAAWESDSVRRQGVRFFESGRQVQAQGTNPDYI